VCPHITTHVSSYYYVCVCSHTNISCYYVCVCPHTNACPHAAMCVLVLLYMCPHTAIYVSSYCYICVLILLYMCPHTTIYVLHVSSYYYICATYVSSCYCMCPHTTIHAMCSHPTRCGSLNLLYMCPHAGREAESLYMYVPTPIYVFYYYICVLRSSSITTIYVSSGRQRGFPYYICMCLLLYMSSTTIYVSSGLVV
jgi:hypothetical protein